MKNNDIENNNNDDNDKNKIIDEFLEKLENKNKFKNSKDNKNITEKDEDESEDVFEKAEREYRLNNNNQNKNLKQTEKKITQTSNNYTNNNTNISKEKEKEMLKFLSWSCKKEDEENEHFFNNYQNNKIKIRKPLKFKISKNYKNTLLKETQNDIFCYHSKNFDSIFQKNKINKKENKTKYNNLSSGKYVKSPKSELKIKKKDYYKTKYGYSKEYMLKYIREKTLIKKRDELFGINSDKNIRRKINKIEILKSLDDPGNPFSSQFSNRLLRSQNLKNYFNDYERGVPYLKIKPIKNRNILPYFIKIDSRK